MDHSNSPKPRPSYDDIEKYAEEAAEKFGVDFYGVLGPSTKGKLPEARKHAWSRLMADGFSILGIAETWGCDRKSVQRVKRELEAA